MNRIASQPFHLIATVGGRRLKRTVDYLALTNDGPLLMDVKRTEELEEPHVWEILDFTRTVVEARGWRYEIGCEPDEVRYANIKFLAGYRRYWLFDATVVSELRGAVARRPGRSIREILSDVAADRGVAKAALMHLLWTQQVRADLAKRLSMNTEVEMAS